jgi:hypothetical protein
MRFTALVRCRGPSRQGKSVDRKRVCDRNRPCRYNRRHVDATSQSDIRRWEKSWSLVHLRVRPSLSRVSRLLQRAHQMKEQASNPQISIIAQGTAYCAVCAPVAMRQGIVETVVALRNRGVTEEKWIAAEGLPFCRPNPRPCPHDGLRQHWLLMRVPATERVN